MYCSKNILLLHGATPLTVLQMPYGDGRLIDYSIGQPPCSSIIASILFIKVLVNNVKCEQCLRGCAIEAHFRLLQKCSLPCQSN